MSDLTFFKHIFRRLGISWHRIGVCPVPEKSLVRYTDPCHCIYYLVRHDRGIFCAGPYCNAPVTMSQIHALCAAFSLPKQAAEDLVSYFDALPVIGEDDVLEAVLAAVCDELFGEAGWASVTLDDSENREALRGGEPDACPGLLRGRGGNPDSPAGAWRGPRLGHGGAKRRLPAKPQELPRHREHPPSKSGGGGERPPLLPGQALLRLCAADRGGKVCRRLRGAPAGDDPPLHAARAAEEGCMRATVPWCAGFFWRWTGIFPRTSP